MGPLSTESVKESALSAQDATIVEVADSAALKEDEAAATESNTAIENEVEDPTSPNVAEDGTPLPKYNVMDRVYGRDQDGLMYAAVIRRRNLGPTFHRQSLLGMDDDDDDKDDEETHSWHYFVHFSRWNVKWDRWLPEVGILPDTQATRDYAALVKNEHDTLRKAMTKKTAGKKLFQSIDAGGFLLQWKKKLQDINNHRVTQAADVTQVQAPDRRRRIPRQDWSKAVLEREAQLRRQCLTRKRSTPEVSALTLPFGLKRVLVEQWEVVAQCAMVAEIPASVTIENALHRYLASKGIMNLGADAGQDDDVVKDPAENDSKIENDAKEDADEQDAADNNSDDIQKWKDMAQGIMMAFDEALPTRLLYATEQEQIAVLDQDDDTADLRYSQLYGCEHLLRLFVRLPALVLEAVPSETEQRVLFARVNDFLRYIHKNHKELLKQSYRRLNDKELAVKEMAKNENNKKRKRESINTAPVESTSSSSSKEGMVEARLVVAETVD